MLRDLTASVRRVAAVLVVLVLAVGTTGCGTLGYYAQAVGGQLRLLAAREPIDALLADPDTDPLLTQRLQLVRAAVAFAETRLDLPAGGRYASYVETGREFVVWNVFAAPRLSVEPLTWCFPVAGCVAYRGYFRRRAAERFAAGLAADGFDTWIGGVDAYSTLGWFDDPVLDTFIDRPPAGLAGLLFHELAHGRVYLPGDTAFNESYATVVELAGLALWAQEHPEAATDWPQHRERLALRQRLSAFVIAWRARLGARYLAAQAALADTHAQVDADAVREKAWAELRADYRLHREQLGGGVFDPLFVRPNNAVLVPFVAYWTYVPAFQVLLDESGSWPAFHAAVARLAALRARRAELAALAARAAGEARLPPPARAGIRSASDKPRR